MAAHVFIAMLGGGATGENYVKAIIQRVGLSPQCDGVNDLITDGLAREYCRGSDFPSNTQPAMAVC
eukprot:XP_001704442.1 Hypothetical protein GL50803_35998 [Giardia lamblia ATCC 50803]